MARSKLKRKLASIKREAEEAEDTCVKDIPIYNLPNKFLKMNVKSGTKMRNILQFAIKEFPNHNNCVLWTAAGHGIGKALSCVEIFKRKYNGLHQITRLRYVGSKRSLRRETEQGQGNVTLRRVPEIHILLSKQIREKVQCGYQAPGDDGCFLSGE